MKVLWLCNVILPMFAKEIGIPASVSGGWLTGAAQTLRNTLDIDVYICASQRYCDSVIEKTVQGIHFIGYPASKKDAHQYDTSVEKYFSKLVAQIQPDLIHIWGTEFAHTLAMVRAVNNPERILVHIQGLCGVYAEHYMAHLPFDSYGHCTLRDIVRCDGMRAQQKKFMRRGKLEKVVLQSIKHVSGRTRWDRACVRQIAPEANYYHCNETLRDSFYDYAGSWCPEKCEKHSIFVSQSSYPIKGFHLALDAMHQVLERYPDAKIYTTGANPFSMPSYRQGRYHKILKKKIRQLGLKDRVVFLGMLSEEEMCSQFLRANVFVSSSSIENSPNSVGEAMLLGVPTVASFVGGTMDMLVDGQEGYLYQSDAPYMLGGYICKVFEDDQAAYRMGQRAYEHAKKTHDPQNNLRTLLKIYQKVTKKERFLSVNLYTGKGEKSNENTLAV